MSSTSCRQERKITVLHAAVTLTNVELLSLTRSINAKSWRICLKTTFQHVLENRVAFINGIDYQLRSSPRLVLIPLSFLKKIHRQLLFVESTDG